MDQTDTSLPSPLRPSWHRSGLIVRTARAVFALMLREIATTFGRSPGGYLWAVAEPVAGVALLTLAFSFVFRTPPLGNNFPLFYATGLLPFMLYSSLTIKIGQAIRYSRPLLTYPAVTFVDAILSRLLLNVLTQLVVFAIVVVGIVLVYDLRIDLDPPRLFNALAMMSLLCLGLGTFNCYMFGAFPIWEQLWGILNRPLFLLSGVFFLVDTVPQQFRDLMLLNPLTHVIAEIRAGFYSVYDGRYVSSIYIYAIGLVFLVLGMLLLYRHHRFLINEGA